MVDAAESNDAPMPQRSNRQWIVAAVCLVAIALVALPLIGNRHLNRNRNARSAVRTLWQLGACVLFEGDKSYVNPPETAAEWDAEQNPRLLDEFTYPKPTVVLFARPRYIPIRLNDSHVPAIIDALHNLPTVSQLDLHLTEISSDGERQLKAALPGVSVNLPPPP
jgi:hypothetical protein